MSDKLAGISTFMAAANAGGFSAAGERLHLTRAAVSKTVARLKERMGVRLFQRTTRSFALTEDGQRFYGHCARARAEIEGVLASFESGRDEPNGRIRVSAPVLFCRAFITPVLIEVAQRYPLLQFEVSLNDQSVDIVEGGFDLAVRLGPLGDSAGLACRKLADLTIMPCAAPSYLALRGMPTRIDELSGNDTLEYSRSRRSGPWATHSGWPGFRIPQTCCRRQIDNLEALAQAAIAGLGLAFLPRWMIAPYLTSGELQAVMVDSRKTLECHVVWPHTSQLPSRTRAVIDALVAVLPERVN